MRLFYQKLSFTHSISAIVEANRYPSTRKSLCEASVNKIKEKVGFQESFFKCHEYCDTSRVLYPDGKLTNQCTTPRCTGIRRDKDGKINYFVSGDMRTQLKEILENEENWNEVTSSLQHTKTDEIYDILDGRKYQEVKNKCKDITGNSDNVYRWCITVQVLESFPLASLSCCE